MHRLNAVLRNNKKVRVIGFDDAPFAHRKRQPVNVAGVVCSNTRFEGMLWGEVEQDGLDSTAVLTRLLLESKFVEQLHLVLLDGIALGGFNIIDLPALSAGVELPCVAVMRKRPDLDAIDRALKNLPDYGIRKALLDKAGEIHQIDGFVFQVCGATPDVVAEILTKLTDNGDVPEALRLAHIIGSAVMTGQSSSRA